MAEETKVFFTLKNEFKWQRKNLNMCQISNSATLIFTRRSLRETIQG